MLSDFCDLDDSPTTWLNGLFLDQPAAQLLPLPPLPPHKPAASPPSHALPPQLALPGGALAPSLPAGSGQLQPQPASKPTYRGLGAALSQPPQTLLVQPTDNLLAAQPVQQPAQVNRSSPPAKSQSERMAVLLQYWMLLRNRQQAQRQAAQQQPLSQLALPALQTSACQPSAPPQSTPAVPQPHPLRQQPVLASPAAAAAGEAGQQAAGPAGSSACGGRYEHTAVLPPQPPQQPLQQQQQQQLSCVPTYGRAAPSVRREPWASQPLHQQQQQRSCRRVLAAPARMAAAALPAAAPTGSGTSVPLVLPVKRCSSDQSRGCAPEEPPSPSLAAYALGGPAMSPKASATLGHRHSGPAYAVAHVAGAAGPTPAVPLPTARQESCEDAYTCLSKGDEGPRVKRARTRDEISREKERERARRSRQRKQERLKLIEEHNKSLRQEVHRLRRTLYLWATQGFVTPDQALQFLTSAVPSQAAEPVSQE